MKERNRGIVCAQNRTHGTDVATSFPVRSLRGDQYGMNIQLAQVDDAETILALQHLAYQSEAAVYNDWTLPPLLETLADLTARFQDRLFLKAMDGDRLVGSVRAFQHGATCQMERLVVHPEYRRRGIGTDLLNRMEMLFPAAECCELFTGHKSHSNLRLYERLGYLRLRQEQVNAKVSLIFLRKTMSRLAIRLERLRLVAATRELLLAEVDVPQLARALQAVIPNNWPMPLYDDDARQHFVGVLTQSPAAVGWTAWYILLTDGPAATTLIGSVGACGPPDAEGRIVIGYSLLDQFQGHGYATEALRGFVEWAGHDARLQTVVADTYPALIASIRVLEKNGFARSEPGGDEGTSRFVLRIR